MLHGLDHALTIMEDCKDLEEARDKIWYAIRLLTWRPDKEMEESRLHHGRMLKESEFPVNLSNYGAKFVGTGFEPVDEIVKELGFEQGREYDLKDIALRLFDGLVNTEEWTFGAEPDDPDAEEPQIDIMVFDEDGDKVGDLFFEMTTEVDESTMTVIFDKLNDMLVNGN